MTCSKF